MLGDEVRRRHDFLQFRVQALGDRRWQAGIANARMNAMSEVWEHPQLKARDRWTEIDTPVGKVPALLPPGMERADHPRMDPVPALGQHTDQVLAEFGFGPEKIAALREAGAI